VEFTFYAALLFLLVTVLAVSNILLQRQLNKQRKALVAVAAMLSDIIDLLPKAIR